MATYKIKCPWIGHCETPVTRGQSFDRHMDRHRTKGDPVPDTPSTKDIGNPPLPSGTPTVMTLELYLQVAEEAKNRPRGTNAKALREELENQKMLVQQLTEENQKLRIELGRQG